MEVQSESNIHFETRDGIWMMEQEKGTGNFQLASAGPWDEYDVSKSYPILYWGQTKSFIQLAKNIWDNGFKFLVEPVEGVGSKRRLKFEFRSPYIPKGTLVTCFVAYNGTGILYRFPDPLNPTDYRQLLISGADERFPQGSVKFSVFHCNNNNNNSGGGMIMNWNSGLNRSNNNNNPNNGVYGIEEVYTHYWMKSASQTQMNYKNLRRRRRRKRNDDDMEFCYPLDFRLENKFFIKEYPLIIRPLNRFYDLRSLYMVELAEKCVFHQGIEHIEEYRREALAKKEKLKEIFLYYPMLLRFCLWYYTPKCYRGGIHSQFNANKKNKKGKKDTFFNNILASIAQYIPQNSPLLENFPKIRLSGQTASDYQQLNLIQQWINKIYYQPDHHCSQCQSWYSIHTINPGKAFQLFSSSKTLNDPTSKKFGYKANTTVMKSIEDEKNKEQKKSIKNIKEKFDNMMVPFPQKETKKKKKKRHAVVISPNDGNATTSNKKNPPPLPNRPPQYTGGGGKGLFSRFFRSSPSSSASNSNTNIASMNNGKQSMINGKNNIQNDSDEWVTIENQTYPLNQNTRMNSTQGITTNNFTMSPDTSFDKIYDNSFNYDFNMDSLSQMPNSQQQLQNVLHDRDLLADVSNDPNNTEYNGLENGTFYTNSRIEEREKDTIEWDEESNLMNFGLNIANMITPSVLASMELDDIPFITSPKLQNKNKKKSNKKDNKETDNAPTIDIDAILEQQQQVQQKQLDQQQQASKEKESIDYKKTEQKIHCCLSSTYYHIPPNTIVNECSSETCYFENRELIAQQLVYKLSYYLIAYRWAKRGVQLGLLVGLYFLSRKLWKSDYFWQWSKNECQERVILLCLKGQLNWIGYLRGKNIISEDDEDFQETIREIRKKEKRVRLLRLQRKREGLSGEELKQLKLRKGIGSMTVLQEIKELLSMIFLENSFRLLGQFKDMIIEWYHRSLKSSVFKVRTWEDFLEQVNILMAALKVQLIHLLELLKRNWNPEIFKRLFKSIHLIKWWNEKMILIKTYIQLALNKPPVIRS